MFREFIISCYLTFFRLIFNIFKLFPQKKKTTFVSSFGDNIFYVANELRNIDNNEEIIILKTNHCKYDFSNIKNIKQIEFKPINIFQFLCGIYHLASSKVIFIDNYFGFLSVTNFKKSVKCIQLWHAVGAIKKFGLKDPSTKKRSERANKRFARVYERFHYIVVGSDKMAYIFMQSFGLANQNILKTGVPRTDFFFNTNIHFDLEKKIKKKYSISDYKKVILYAPTFRDNQTSCQDISLNIYNLRSHLKEDYVLLLKLHPSIKSSFDNNYSDFVIDVSDSITSHILLISDILITDYSSIPFEYSLLNKPMIFFAYDLVEYNISRGFWGDYTSNIPGPMATNSEDIIDIIKNNKFNFKDIQNFAYDWNQYNKGDASKKVIEYIYK